MWIPGSQRCGGDGGLLPIARESQQAPSPGQLPERGAVELKALRANLEELRRSGQVRRYLETYGLCLISNDHQFRPIGLRQGEPTVLEGYDLTKTAEDFWGLPG
jgi:hypothetical protein